MADAGYNQFCPVAKACELLQPRWTLLVLCEMWSGSTRFNDIHRGVPGMSPTLLSRRLKEMEAHGLIRHDATGYHSTAMARKLEPIVRDLGRWAHGNIDCEVSLRDLDSRLLMWNVRRKIDPGQFPGRRCVVQFTFPEQPAADRDYWLIARPGCETDLCVSDPGFAVDLFVESSLKTLTGVWMGWAPLRPALDRGDIYVCGDAALKGSIERWLVLSSFAGPVPDRTDGQAV
ncbi:DNA-binding HxlR family transcriptional regulator [Endobacter medicaginis]|uniref:DNA-binding HxlR family transcriptional regulator n=1 Tax=Endobacter medicaginis TaxID=1181271 RepID=A0A839V3Q1_9PROT|nr:helix-turn-helix domain-containing protein [Endobacter medicaginis]MBB3175170.1 DNA-binding HxlR family transcriptional regulator [Endobacter medicaginis]MCX5476027.1 helix-turn-helix domain-containing protein [Endobacter medicaginis]NVN31415.1 helix-turn-helix transcriptional regulator [Endobacter medicaginis]